MKKSEIYFDSQGRLFNVDQYLTFPEAMAKEALYTAPISGKDTYKHTGKNKMEKEFTGRAAGDKVIVKQHKTEEKIGILFVPETTRVNLNRGTVVSVGPGTKDDKTDEFKVGDVILYDPHAQSNINVGGQDYAIIRSLAVWCIL